MNVVYEEPYSQFPCNDLKEDSPPATHPLS